VVRKVILPQIMIETAPNNPKASNEISSFKSLSNPDFAEILSSIPRNGIENCPIKFIMPTIKLKEEMTYPNSIDFKCPGVVIRLQDLLSADGHRLTPLFWEIVSNGGIHDFLRFDRTVILSSIMKDQMILGCSKETYRKAIGGLQPDYYITPDGETYQGEKNISAYEIRRICNDTLFLMRNCGDCKPIGLVKGCNLNQIIYHTRQLSDLGIDIFLFHAGPFLDAKTLLCLNNARIFFNAIRNLAPRLLIYGIGARDHLKLFISADGYITNSHYMAAFKRLRLTNGKWEKDKKTPTIDLIDHNLHEIEKCLLNIQSSERIERWC